MTTTSLDPTALAAAKSRGKLAVSFSAPVVPHTATKLAYVPPVDLDPEMQVALAAQQQQQMPPEQAAGMDPAMAQAGMDPAAAAAPPPAAPAPPPQPAAPVPPPQPALSSAALPADQQMQQALAMGVENPQLPVAAKLTVQQELAQIQRVLYGMQAMMLTLLQHQQIPVPIGAITGPPPTIPPAEPPRSSGGGGAGGAAAPFTPMPEVAAKTAVEDSLSPGIGVAVSDDVAGDFSSLFT